MKITGNENNRAILLELGQRIKNLRVSQNITQADMAERAGVSLATVTRIEKGEGAKLDNVLSLFRVLGILGNIDILVPEQEIRPTELADFGHMRQRASKASKQKEIHWVWGEDK